MSRRIPLSAFLFSICSVAIAGSGSGARHASLYERLGGPATVNAFVSDGVDRAGIDAADLTAVKTNLAQHICALTGGGCRATGGVPVAQFIESLRSSMRSHAVPIAARNELLEILTRR